MKNYKRYLLLAFLSVLFLIAPAIAIDYMGDFSSRSLIMKSLNREDRINQEQKDILSSRKLIPNQKCLIEQIKKNNIENVEILLSSKVNPNIQYNAEYPIYIAAKMNNFEMVKLLYSNGAKLDKGFNSELYEAIRNKNTEMAMFLLENNARVNFKDAVNGKTPLYLALQNNMFDVAEVLLDKGANVNQKTFCLIKRKKQKNLLEKLNLN